MEPGINFIQLQDINPEDQVVQKYMLPSKTMFSFKCKHQVKTSYQQYKRFIHEFTKSKISISQREEEIKMRKNIVATIVGPKDHDALHMIIALENRCKCFFFFQEVLFSS